VNALPRVLTALLLAGGLVTFAAEVIPPAPAQYFNDYANIVSGGTRQQLNQRLEQFERETSNQILVAVFSKMQSDSSIEDYTVRVAQSWMVGQKARNNGAVLFVFIKDRKLFLQVGYGLEGALPDALCKRIIEDEIKPGFKAGNYDAGLTAGVNAILAATQGEYKGTGRTVANSSRPAHKSHRSQNQMPPSLAIFLVIIVLFIVFALPRRRRGGFYSSGGWSSGGGGLSRGGGGGFSGGGGRFGGGGAGGSW